MERKEFEQLKAYKATVEVRGFADTYIMAKSMEDANKSALKFYNSLNCGQLSDVEAIEINIEEVPEAQVENRYDSVNVNRDKENGNWNVDAVLHKNNERITAATINDKTGKITILNNEAVNNPFIQHEIESFMNSGNGTFSHGDLEKDRDMIYRTDILAPSAKDEKAGLYVISIRHTIKCTDAEAAVKAAVTEWAETTETGNFVKETFGGSIGYGALCAFIWAIPKDICRKYGFIFSGTPYCTGTPGVMAECDNFLADGNR